MRKEALSLSDLAHWMLELIVLKAHRQLTRNFISLQGYIYICMGFKYIYYKVQHTKKERQCGRKHQPNTTNTLFLHQSILLKIETFFHKK